MPKFLTILLLVIVGALVLTAQQQNFPNGSAGGLPNGLTYVAPTLTVSTAGGGNGQSALSGNTSGTCTDTVDATSTTITTNCALVATVNGTAFGSGGVRWAGLFTTLNASGVVTEGGLTNGGTGHVLLSGATPTIAAGGCGGAAASIPSNNGTTAFTVNVGTTPGSACTFTLATAAADWICNASDLTTANTSVFLQKQTGAASTTGATITNFNTAGAATAFVASDVLRVSCFAY
jgi:hypothetical protein